MKTPPNFGYKEPTKIMKEGLVGKSWREGKKQGVSFPFYVEEEKGAQKKKGEGGRENGGRLAFVRFGDKRRERLFFFFLEKERLTEGRLRKKRVNRRREKKKRVWFVVSFFFLQSFLLVFLNFEKIQCDFSYFFVIMLVNVCSFSLFCQMKFF